MTHQQTLTHQRNTDVVIDVTSLISAEDFLLAQNRSARPDDPFGRQCFVEIVQSLIFMSRVYVVHPILLVPSASDFGERPLLLQALVQDGLLHPLRLTPDQTETADRLESSAIEDLESVHGFTSIARFVEQTFSCDQASKGQQAALSARLRDWSLFHEREVRLTKGHHSQRIPTSDGIEEDRFGEWARAAAVVMSGALQGIAAPGQSHYLMATLARCLKYRARAEASDVSYQSHPMRRDFSLTFDLTRKGAADATVLDLIQAVRGIHDSLRDAAGGDEYRLQLLQLARSLSKQFAFSGAQPYQRFLYREFVDAWKRAGR